MFERITLLILSLFLCFWLDFNQLNLRTWDLSMLVCISSWKALVRHGKEQSFLMNTGYLGDKII